MNPKKIKEGYLKPEEVKDNRAKARETIERLKSRQASKVPFRIDDRTVIYVDPKNANKEYAEMYLSRLNKSRMNAMYI